MAFEYLPQVLTVCVLGAWVSLVGYLIKDKLVSIEKGQVETKGAVESLRSTVQQTSKEVALVQQEMEHHVQLYHTAKNRKPSR